MHPCHIAQVFPQNLWVVWGYWRKEGAATEDKEVGLRPSSPCDDDRYGLQKGSRLAFLLSARCLPQCYPPSTVHLIFAGSQAVFEIASKFVGIETAAGFRSPLRIVGPLFGDLLIQKKHHNCSHGD